ncbi:N-ethylmaleimide reductase [Tistlia consotensis]|uniref:N-ethylmaleimide reductase n=1 Tax=Tistlia consotensis USBA 355 TaxID=560819 RepID=A0A1Y6BLN9_9PROT|nr:alkene reductase [Tistlia consotensis]SMF09672.1 N-ethylmaleimide reductase [Tistlia consotensis USBA 355]SNR34325.1 N-ethylmaleimide reductase [Tistlia consotensis]
MTEKLFTPLTLGDLELPNRVVMAPLTRNRALPEGDVPHALNARYYAQRASAGLIVTEATQISPEGKGYAWTPGIYSEAQVEGWRLVTDAVHAKGGRIFAQLWHVGRVSHVSLQPNGRAPVAPSAITARTRTFDGKSFVETSAPRALETDEIPRIVADYRKAAENARAAGFDGIELHGANGYLIDQFLRDCSNRRTDAYGGSLENRARLLIEVLEALSIAWPVGRIGLRLSPFSNANDVADSDPMKTFGYVLGRVNNFRLSYLHLVEGQTGGSRDLPEGADLQALRRRFDGPYMANNGYDRAMAIDAVESGSADLIAFGKPFIANPDLVERLRRDAPLNEPDRETFYGGGEKGYVDYPTLTDIAA